MSEKNNHVVFKGQISDGASAETVKEKLASLFKVNLAQAEAMLSGKPVYIKKNVDLVTAKKYQTAMLKAGAVAEILSSNTQQTEAQPQAAASSTPPQAPASKNSAPTGIELPGNTATTEMPDTQAPRTVVEIDANAVDISEISMAATGTELQSIQAETAEPELDISNLSLTSDNDDNLSQKNEAPTLEIDTSELSLE